jgi:hypothetical protein
VINVSDLRCKTNISPLTYGLNELSSLNPVSFYWCNDIVEQKGSNKQIGFVAQEVNEIIPEAVSQSSDGIYSLSPDKIIPVLVKSVQELKDKVNQLDAIIKRNGLS